jgi:hypothetical protein
LQPGLQDLRAGPAEHLLFYGVHNHKLILLGWSGIHGTKKGIYGKKYCRDYGKGIIMEDKKIALYAIIAGILIMLAIIIIGVILNSGIETSDDAIKCTGGSSIRTSFLTSTKIITAQVTFTNTGKQPHTFYGGVSIFDQDFHALGYRGETMTLGPGGRNTITESFVVDYSYDFKDIVCEVE